VSLALGGSATALIEALTIRIDNQCEGIPGLIATSDLSKIRRRGPVLVRMSGTLDFADLTEYANFVNQTEQTVKVYVTKASSFSMLFDIPRMVYSAFPVAMTGRERITVDFEGMCRYHVGSQSSIKVSLTTTKSDY